MDVARDRTLPGSSRSIAPDSDLIRFENPPPQSFTYSTVQDIYMPAAIARDRTLPGSSRSIMPYSDLIQFETPPLPSFTYPTVLDELFQSSEEKLPTLAHLDHLDGDPINHIFFPTSSMPYIDAHSSPVRHPSIQSESVAALSSAVDSENVSHLTK